MKLSQKQLRTLIEGIVKENGYDPAVDHAPDERSIMVDRMTAMVEEAWKALYDESDPTMAASGPASWEQQCEAAAAQFGSALEQLLENTEEALSNGDFFR